MSVGLKIRSAGVVLLIMLLALGASATQARAGGWQVDISPAIGDFYTFNAESCPAVSVCTVVGNYQPFGANDDSIYVLRQTGGSFVTQSTPHPPGGLPATLAGVSCSTVSICVAVGSGPHGTLIEQWDGGVWRLVPSPFSDRRGAGLVSVSCTAPDACTAVGSNRGRLLVLRWNGAHWHVQPAPAPPGAALVSVSCAAADSCVAVGHTAGGPALIEAWNGVVWRVKSVPAAAAGWPLTSVSCASRDYCVAVAMYGALVRNGAVWSVLPGARPDDGSHPAAVSCPAVGRCEVVGSQANFPLAEALTGSTWTVQEPVVPDAFSDLLSVSCARATHCIAAGSLFGMFMDGDYLASYDL